MQNRHHHHNINAVINYEVRSTALGRFLDIAEFIFLNLVSMLSLSYLVILQNEAMANIKLAVALLILLKVTSAFLASYALKVGFRRELDKILKSLGTDRKKARSVQ